MDCALNYKNNIKQLKVEFERLKYTIQRLQLSIDEAKSKREVIADGVEVWLSTAEEAATEVEKILAAADAKSSRFNLLCPDLKRRYQLSRKAEKGILSIAELRGKDNFERVSYRPIPQWIASTSVDSELALPSRSRILEEVVEALADDSINRVGIYGMGGTGKSTLAEEVWRQAMQSKLFDAVVMAVVAQTPDPENIQKRIADQLGLTFEEENITARASRLYQRLMMEKKVLVFLDDVWEKLDLDIIGIPSASDHKGCKLLLTSRSVHVLSTGMDTQKDFRLDNLPSDEAWTLFQNTVGDFRDPELQSVAIEIAERCEGLPLAIVTVAKALKDKDLTDWENALMQLSVFESSENRWEGIMSALELSYNSLGVEQRAIFLLCGLLGQANGIRILDLLKYSIGLDLIENKETVKYARRRLHQLITDLKAYSFLQDGGKNGLVNMHNLVYDFAVMIAHRDHKMFIVKDDDRLENWPEEDSLKNSSRISLHRCDVHELPERLECPELEYLLLSNENPSLRIPDSFFEQIQKLKVLDISGMSLLSLPLSLGSLTNLCTLCLDGCVLGDLALLGELKNLAILTFRNSDIVELPRELEQLGGLKLLDLSHCSKLKLIPAKLISRLSQLEELYMNDSFVDWEVQGPDDGNNTSLAELEHLPHLTTLEVRIPDAKMLSRYWMPKKLERYRILIGDDLEWNAKEDISKKMEFAKLNIDIHSFHGLIILLKEAEGLHVHEVKGVKDVLHDLHSQDIPSQLKHLSIQNVSELQYISDSVNNVPFVAFPTLQTLELEGLINLEHISLAKLAAGSFRSLQIIKVRNCNKLKHFFSFWMIGHLVRLEEMEVADCGNMENIVCDRSEDDSNGKGTAAQLTRLSSLALAHLPHLRSFCSTSQTAHEELKTDPGLGEIELDTTPLPLFDRTDFCPNLMNLKLSSISCVELFPSAPSSYSLFQNLTILEVSNCNGLMNLVSSSVAENMLQLVSMRVQDCDLLRQIVADEHDKMPKTITFLKLKALTFVGLRNIKCFCSGNYHLKFPSLEEVIIANCPMLRIFSLGISTTPKLNRVLTQFPDPAESRWAGNLNDTINQMTTEIEPVPTSQDD